MGPDVPLLNDYKQEFFWKRFPQTILGGPRLKLGYCAPPYVYIHQLVLFFTPWLLGGVGTLLYQLGVMDDISAGILSGGLMLVVGAMLQTLSQWVARRTGAVQRLTVGHNVMVDEEEVEFTRCAGPETVRFVAPGKRFMGNVVLHTGLAGVMCGFGTWYLLPDRLTAVFGSVGAAVPLFVLSWVTMCIGEYSLIVNTAAETATFQPQDTYEITALTRPLYIFTFISVDLALRCVGGGVAELQVASQVMHMLFLALPVLWALGLLPPIDALVLWLMEQSLIHVLGGSAMATNRRLVVMFLSSTCVSVSAFFVPSSLGVVLFTVTMGFLLSQDLTQIPVLLWGWKQDSHTYTHSGSLSLGWWSLPLSALLLTAAMSEAALLHTLRPAAGQNLSSWESWKSPDVVSDPQTLVGWILVALFVITLVLREIQGACVLGGLVINPLYPKRVSSVQAFRKRSRGLWAAGLTRRALVNLACPLAMIAFLSMDRALQGLNTAALAIGMTRAFRVVWQRSEDALLQMVVVITVRLVDGGGVAQKWHDLGIGVQLILVSLVLDRLSQFLLKLKFALTVLVTSWTETKQRRQSAGALLVLNMALCPLLVGVVMLAALLSAPLLPLFTLPVFLVGFPRPLRSWPGTPGTACPCPDSIYYQQLSTRLASALRHALASGALGSYSPGSHFLGRFQDRVLWISILEKGYGYCTVNIKGLELQETSCHTVEARRVDEVFEAAFDRLERPGRFLHFLNTHWGNTLTPCALLPVTIYSDARNVLTGIIDSPDHLRQLRSDFLKALVWILLRHSMQNRTYRVKSHSLRSSQHAVQPESGSSGPKPGGVSQSHFDSSSSPQLRGRSSLSSFSDWSDEDDLFGPVSVRKPVRRMIMRTEEEHASLPGSVEIHSLYENMALASLPTLRPLGLGIGLDKEKDEALPVSSAPFDNFDSANPPNFSSPHSESLSLPASWFSAPFCNSKLRPLRSSFPSEWFRFCLAQLVIEGLWEGEEEQSVCRALQEDRALMEMYSQVALSCALALGLDLAVPSASFVFRVYCGDSAWHEGLDWLRENNELNQLTLRAFRYSVKLLIDQASLGPVESMEELYSTLHDYHQHWFIGMTSECGWHDGVLQEKPFLFSLGHDLTMGSYTGRVLSLQECVFQLGALCEECVRGQWANLSWELLYATNDDEERYSIQAHTLLLRNLTVQAAEPPLGYPIHSSSPTHLACF